jgi:hypothetical protein
MFRGEKTKIFWLGLVTFSYSFFLFCQGIWLSLYYTLIYPVLVPIPFPSDYNSPYTGIFHEAGAILPSLFGGIILIIGLNLMDKKVTSRGFWWGLIVLGYSFILLLQAIWVLFGFPYFYSQLYRYATTSVFINFPRFFTLLGVVIPPIIGLIIFSVVGLQLMTIIRTRKNALLSDGNHITNFLLDLRACCAKTES